MDELTIYTLIVSLINTLMYQMYKQTKLQYRVEDTLSIEVTEDTLNK